LTSLGIRRTPAGLAVRNLGPPCLFGPFGRPPAHRGLLVVPTASVLRLLYIPSLFVGFLLSLPKATLGGSTLEVKVCPRPFFFFVRFRRGIDLVVMSDEGVSSAVLDCSSS